MSRARVSDIITIAARISGVSAQAIIGMGRTRPVVRVRQAVYFVARENGHSYPQIGVRMNRDHSSVLHGVSAAMDWADRFPEYATFLKNLTTECAKAGPFVALPAAVTAIIPDVQVRPMPARPKRYVPVLHPPTPRLATPARTMKPKNDFRAGQMVADDSHRFQDSIALGSADLLAAIQRVRAA